jgi:hypothetical protein
MINRAAFLAELRRWHDGASWHGPALAALLEDIDAATAAARPVRGGPTIWEITLHVTAWAVEVARRLRGAAPGLPLDGDWPPAPELPTAAAWSVARSRLVSAQADLLAAVHLLPEERLDELLAEGCAQCPGGGSVRALICGTLRHESHHAGQVSMLLMMLTGGPRSRPVA